MSAENSKIMAYSLRKIKINPVAPYSTLNPETSSDSPQSSAGTDDSREMSEWEKKLEKLG